MFDLEPAITAWRQKLLAAGLETPVPLEELELHLREDVERQMSAGLDAEEAFALAVGRIGEAGALKVEFKNAGTMNGGSFHRSDDKMLAVFALYAALINLVMIIEPWVQGSPLGGFWVNLARLGLFRALVASILLWRDVGDGWMSSWLVLLNFIYIAAMLAALWARRYRPKSAHRWTLWLNWALLPAWPLGTLIGLYSLWRGAAESRAWNVNGLTTTAPTVQNRNLAGSLRAAFWAVMSVVMGFVGLVTLLHGLLEFAVSNGFNLSSVGRFAESSSFNLFIVFTSLFIDVARMILGAWLFACAGHIIRSPRAQLKKRTAQI